MLTLRQALSNYLASRSPQGLVGGPPYFNNPNLRDVPDNTGLASRYLSSMDVTGDKLHYPDALLPTICDPAVGVGQPVRVKGYDEARDGTIVEPAIPGGLLWPPIGMVRLKVADDIAMVSTPDYGEMPWAGAKPGDLYVAGTDGKLAVKGAANYPVAGTMTMVEAIAIAPDWVLIVAIPYVV